jgi:hypothetical protein
MPARLADSLLALAASIDGDGGYAVCRTLATLLRDTAPFDAGEVVLRHGGGFHRFPIGGDERPVAGDDLVAQVLSDGAPLRLDDPRDLEPFAETRERMAEGGLKSALVLPLGAVLHVPAAPHAASPSGVLVLARRHGWAFVGASLHFLGPVASMAGMALDRSLALTALGHPAGLQAGADSQPGEALRQEGASLVAELQRLRSVSAASGRKVEALRSTLAVTRDELADARGATIAAQSALDQAVGRCHELQARIDRGELPKREGGRRASNPGEAAVPASPAAESAPVEAALRPTSAPEPLAEPAATETQTSSPEPAAAATETPSPEPAAVAEPTAVESAIAEPQIAAAAAAPPPARRGRRRRRGAFEPPGGPGAA